MKKIGNLPWRILVSLVNAAIDFIYPPYCIICECHLAENERVICEQCWCQVPQLDRDDDLCRLAATGFGEGLFFSRAISIWEFKEPIQTAIHYLKYQGFRVLAQRMGLFMAERLLEEEIFKDDPVLIPVPLHKTRVRERGYNQSALLCQAIAAATGIPFYGEILKRTRYTRSQTKLTAAERVKNVENAFQVCDPEKVRNRLVVLVDDVITTGSTMNACAKELMKNGAKKIYLLSAAKA